LKDVVDEVRRRYTMATGTSAIKEAEDRRHEAAMDKLGAKLAKKIGSVRVLGGGSPVVKAFNEVKQKERRRKIN
jgi:hypothetical protein